MFKIKLVYNDDDEFAANKFVIILVGMLIV